MPLVGDLWIKVAGVLMIATGGAGVLGLSFTWHRALVSFTLCAWLVVSQSVLRIVLLVVNHQSDPMLWTLWLLNAVASLPTALLSSTMHLLRVWRPRPLV